MVSKTNVLALFFAIATVFFVGTTVYFYFQSYPSNQRATSPTTQTTTMPEKSFGNTKDEMVRWKDYGSTPDASLGYQSYQIKAPNTWKQIEHSSNFQATETFQDQYGDFTYQLIVHQEKNLSQKTGKPYGSLRELMGSYELPTTIVDGQQAAQVQPRAGSESNYKVVFFSKDMKLIFSIELDTPRDGSKLKEGKELFDQILPTFKFTNLR